MQKVPTNTIITHKERGGSCNQAIEYIDESNDLMQDGYLTNDQFVGNDESDGLYATFKPEKKK